MGLTLKNIKPSYELCKYGNVNHPYSDDFDVISYINKSFVEPVKQPIDPALPIVIQENNVDINTEAIANAMAFALYQNDATAIVDVTDFYKQIVYEMSQTNPLHPNKWLVDWARERVNRKTPYPRPNNMVFYTVDSDVIPECKDFLVIGDNQDKVVSAFSYTFNPNSLGVAFRMESDFDDFKEKFAELVNKEASNLSTDTSNQCQEFLKTKLSKLTLDIALRNNKFEDNNEPYSFAQLLRYSLDNYIATNQDKSFYIPFQTSEFFLPSVINFINIEKHSHSNKNDILAHWNKIIKLLNSNVTLWNKKSIKSLQKIISLSNQSTSMVKSLHEQKKEELQRANVPVALTAPSTKILEKRILKIIKKTTDVNKSMNVYKTLKRSFAKPNRRNPDDYDKTGIIVSKKYRPDIHIYQDTSGSISEENYEAATRMLIDLAIKLNVDLYYTSFSHIISKETKIKIKGRSKQAIYKSIQSIPKVSGGTDFKLVWDVINQRPERQKQIAFMITDMEYHAPSTESNVPKNLYYIPIANIPWQRIQNATKSFLNSIKHYKQKIRRNILY